MPICRYAAAAVVVVVVFMSCRLHCIVGRKYSQEFDENFLILCILFQCITYFLLFGECCDDFSVIISVCSLQGVIFNSL